VGADDRLLHPGVTADVNDDLNGEVEAGVEAIACLAGVRVDEIAGVGHNEAIAPQKPLVHFRLPLVDLLPFVVERNGFLRARRFVIDNAQRAFGIDQTSSIAPVTMKLVAGWKC
jgi:hypothetical protein